ncbi:hypothetical protein [Streptomyces spiralis]
MPRVEIVDDRPVARRGMAAVLGDGPDLEVVVSGLPRTSPRPLRPPAGT